MSRELNELLANLETCDLKMAAFDLTKTLGDGVYPNEMVQALSLFTSLPCPETGVILLAVRPDLLKVLATSNSGFANRLPKERRGPHFDDLEKWMDSFNRNLRASDSIQQFLLTGAINRTIRIGFHRMRDQGILFTRLAEIGIRKGFFSNGRQFLRDAITRKKSAFRSVVDLICIHGIDQGRERFWNALGAEIGPQWHLQSEIQYDLSDSAGQFAQLTNQLCHS